MFGTEKPYQVDAPVAGQPRSETLSSLLENRPSDRAMLAAIDKAAPGLGSGNNNAMVAAMMKARRLEREREMMKKKQILARLMGKGPSGTA
jgi:hypothetical protein